MLTYTLNIIEKRTETSDSVTLVFKQPGIKKVKYKAGQYLTLIVRINGRRYIRPYSFSSAFGIDSNIEVTVKRVAGGIVSNHIVDVLAAGDVLEVMPPMGDFIVEDELLKENTHILLWGVGSGVTPLFSIAKDLLFNKPESRITLIYGNKNHDSAIFAERLSALEEKYTERFKVVHFHTRSILNASQTHILSGRINPDKALSILNVIPALTQTLHYICGPAGLKESVRTSLLQYGVSSEKIFSEDFEIVKNPEDFKDITTQTVQITKDNVPANVEVIKGKSILEGGLDFGLELNYSCQTGNCSVCKGYLVAGKIKTIGMPQRDDLAKDEYLLCCSYPISENTHIEIR
jgi:ring-1,2-phenylacetyl-CoA epoxidase subunit PaaE